MEKTKKRERRCPECFAYIRADSRKCRFCAYVFKSHSQHLLDKIKQVFTVEKGYPVSKDKGQHDHSGFFTPPEIEYLLKMTHLKIEIFFVLDDLAFLDEMSLIQLGRTLSAMSENDASNNLPASQSKTVAL